MSFTRNGFQSPELEYKNSTDITANISVLISGTSTLSQDIQVSFMIDPDTLAAYNRANFNLDSSKYYSLLPEDCYTFNSMSATIKSGDDYGLVPLVVKGSKVNKYKNYVLPLRLTETSNYLLSKSQYTVELLNINFVNKFNGKYAISGALNSNSVSGNSILNVVDEQTCYALMGTVDVLKPNYENYFFTINFNESDHTVTLNSSYTNNLVEFQSLDLDKLGKATNYYTETSTLRTIKLSYQYLNLEAGSAVTRFDGYLVLGLTKEIN